MSQQLTMFMEKLLREVQEGVPQATRVRLQTEGTTWETWEPLTGVDPQQWATDAESLIAVLTPELPKRRVQLIFVAESSAGTVISQIARTVTGQNASAQDLGTQNGAKALADAIASVAKTADYVLEMARKMMDFQASQLEKTHSQLDGAHEMFMAIRKVELESDQQESAASKIMLEQVQQATPMLMAMIQHWATSPKKDVGSAVAAAANAVTNGAKAS